MGMIFNPGMAFATIDLPVKRSILTKSFTAVGLSTSVPVDIGRVTITGTFVGTVSLERQEADATWVTVQTWTAPALLDIYKDTGRGFCNMRFNCSAYTSGTAVCKIEA